MFLIIFLLNEVSECISVYTHDPHYKNNLGVCFSQHAYFEYLYISMMFIVVRCQLI